jgi:hypothetical protein
MVHFGPLTEFDDKILERQTRSYVGNSIDN